MKNEEWISEALTDAYTSGSDSLSAHAHAKKRRSQEEEPLAHERKENNTRG
ncbi:hypothetical protein [Ectobacillus panaciterrae]|uniref:hypothetical protein n=1 Tax=Ectobacillus panaciterrae TaxID=363872 RepID=UPI00040BF564|nr:hypothetical protein [Ectobacillus panaciterrae]